MLLPRFLQKFLVVGALVSRRQTMACNFGGECLGSAVNIDNNISYISSSDAASLDHDLFSKYSYSVDQLMELAGLSVAVAVAKHYPVDKFKRVLVVCGPGNNGGDGLVAARHLALFGYRPTLLYPRRTAKPLYQALLHQCQQFYITALDAVPSELDFESKFDVMVDALFGFSFKPPVRGNLKPALDLLINTKLPVCCVDVPSGWDVDKGPGKEEHVKPAVLVSLSAPKKCARPEFLRPYDTSHVLGGRFLPPDILITYNLVLPVYSMQELIVKVH